MNIFYKNSKGNKCYREFVENPEDRAKRRAFARFFNDSIADEAANLHNRMKLVENAAVYNNLFGSAHNGIELKQGQKDKENLILKVRVTRSYRKFFSQLVDVETLSCLKQKDWQGKFELITDIYVIEINHHDYKGV
jgi:hypothetical protein